jgi:hypothetical protein
MNPSIISSIRSAIAESIRDRSVPYVGVSDLDATVRWIERNFDDVDWDPFPDRITIFGDDPSVPCDDNGEGSHFVLYLVSL